jgi:heme/copper-type cytochrome/quinol oxidase subunit 4
VNNSKIKIPNSETGTWELKDVSALSTRKDKDEAIMDFFVGYSAKIKEIEKNFQEIEKNLLAKEIEEKKSSNRNIEILAIFVTLFTFISIDTQILRSGISFVSAVGFSLIILGALLFFIFSLNFFITNEKKWENYFQYFLLLIIPIVMIGVGLSFIYLGEKSFSLSLDNKYYNKLEVDQKISEESNKALENFKKCISSKGGYWPCI